MIGPTGDPSSPFYNPELAPSKETSGLILLGLSVAQFGRNVYEFGRTGNPVAGATLFLQLNQWVADNMDSIYLGNFQEGVYSPEGIHGVMTV